MYKIIEFTKDFGTRKNGFVWECDPLLASKLVRKDKVAKYVKKAPHKSENPKTTVTAEALKKGEELTDKTVPDKRKAAFLKKKAERIPKTKKK